ncbi:nucleotidyltransferase [Mycobacterium phage prophiGD54-2]|uniref:DNA polymerase beta superfamily protein n=1 Tax=Mycobacteroides abscessus TaxID=36809 RepID=UPI0019CF94F2|nr:nucleotidyltransferase domain-containing protein [Mycobacteroides abscessus]QSM04655.1 nucleotidyltransferase [Mycobacterium phage prophiGD54-2]QSN19644.1 nucleotidyltransferase domain-containing protein [Mycobacteroides abscessus subsp. abscessus]
MSHHSPRHKEIASNGLILLTEIGSGLHGVTIANTDDHDEMGICIPPPECVLGLEKFEQYADRWHADGTRIPDGVRSQHGDTDHTTYALNKWARLAAQGNPTVLLPLFAPPKSVYSMSPEGQDIVASRNMFLSKDAGWRFHGYLKAQRARMIGEKGRSKHKNRRELVEQHGFDTKMAYHALRLAVQGSELMLAHTIEIPMDQIDVVWLRQVRHGGYSLDTITEWLDTYTNDLEINIERSTLPDHVDRDELNDFLIGLHYSFWKRTGQL